MANQRKNRSKNNYSLGRKCPECHVPIVNGNKSGKCKDCKNIDRYMEFVSRRRGEASKERVKQ